MSENLKKYNDPKLKPGMRNILPNGDYAAAAQKIDLTSAKTDVNSKMLLVSLVVALGEFEGRWLMDRMVLEHRNPTAVRLGKRRYKTFSDAALGRDANDTEELLDKPVLIRVIVRNDPEYGLQNDIVDYRSLPAEMRHELNLHLTPG